MLIYPVAIFFQPHLLLDVVSSLSISSNRMGSNIGPGARSRREAGQALLTVVSGLMNQSLQHGLVKSLREAGSCMPGAVVRPFQSWPYHFLLQLEFCVFNPRSDGHRFRDWSFGLLGTQVFVRSSRGPRPTASLLPGTVRRSGQVRRGWRALAWFLALAGTVPWRL